MRTCDPNPWTKPQLRARMTAWRAGVGSAARELAGRRVAAAVLALPELSTPRRVLAYAATPRELPTAELIDALLAAGHDVAVPVITGPRAMRGRRLGPGGSASLVAGALGVPAPPPHRDGPDGAGDGPQAWMDHPDVALLPGLAFDPGSGTRLGRGGGFYDAWLDEHPGAVPVGLAFDPQRVAGVPRDPHDRPVAALVTPAGVLRFSRETAARRGPSTERA